jgi:hypothetical protein
MRSDFFRTGAKETVMRAPFRGVPSGCISCIWESPYRFVSYPGVLTSCVNLLRVLAVWRIWEIQWNDYTVSCAAGVAQFMLFIANACKCQCHRQSETKPVMDRLTLVVLYNWWLCALATATAADIGQMWVERTKAKGKQPLTANWPVPNSQNWITSNWINFAKPHTNLSAVIARPWLHGGLRVQCKSLLQFDTWLTPNE